MAFTAVEAEEHLNRVIEWFGQKNYENVNISLNEILDAIRTGREIEYKDYVSQTFHNYLKDLKKAGKYRYDASLVIQNILIGVIKQGMNQYEKVTLAMLPLSKNWQRGTKNIENIAEMGKSPKLTKMARYYMYCFAYLVSVEGIFESVIRMIYGFHCQLIGTPKTLDQVNAVSLAQIKVELIAGHVKNSILFEGYLDGCFRNAIAHNDFWYVNDEEGMHFRHEHQGVPRIDETKTIEEFYEIWAKLFAVVESGLEFTWLIRLVHYQHLMNDPTFEEEE